MHGLRAGKGHGFQKFHHAVAVGLGGVRGGAVGDELMFHEGRETAGTLGKKASQIIAREGRGRNKTQQQKHKESFQTAHDSFRLRLNAVKNAADGEG
ncbi:hypothetical protein GCM10007315_28610 [Gemmobacter tilapiae]|uniref:Uncharacterized protein n=1 Tax=Neogemmobacter tilapiae TaxID=875041 RepID=A0A918WPR7_9RHOB|nr:hypothetical protein GCM10007315_28610 [Gemmobacter tilapiae]